MSDISGSSSTKVSAQQDDRLKAATEGMIRSGRSTHAQEWKDPEPSGEDQPDVDAAPEGTLTGGTPAGMTPADVEDRSDLARYLGRPYPADRDALIEAARANSAPDRLLELLDQLPTQRSFDTVQDVWVALGGGAEEQRF